MKIDIVYISSMVTYTNGLGVRGGALLVLLGVERGGAIDSTKYSIATTYLFTS